MTKESNITTKVWYKKWWILVIVVVVVVGILASTSVSILEAETSYDTEAVEKGTPTGYEKVLGNGDFIVGDDIEPGLYNITGIGWADNVSSGLNMTNANDDGTYSNFKLEEGDTLSILDQANTAGSYVNNTVKEGEDITFIQIEPETIQAQTVVEKVEFDSSTQEETCYINDEEVKCNELEKYDELEKEIKSQK